MNLAQPIVIHFTSHKEIEEQAYHVLLATINDAFHAAKGNLEKMRDVELLAKELRYMAVREIDTLINGAVPKKEPLLAEVRP